LLSIISVELAAITAGNGNAKTGVLIEAESVTRFKIALKQSLTWKRLLACKRLTKQLGCVKYVIPIKIVDIRPFVE
jgi:LEA14-like dessication related protein